jgi:hypothetical protein
MQLNRSFFAVSAEPPQNRVFAPGTGASVLPQKIRYQSERNKVALGSGGFVCVQPGRNRWSATC